MGNQTVHFVSCDVANTSFKAFQESLLLLPGSVISWEQVGGSHWGQTVPGAGALGRLIHTGALVTSAFLVGLCCFVLSCGLFPHHVAWAS